MATFDNGESGLSVRTKINAAIEKIDNFDGRDFSTRAAAETWVASNTPAVGTIIRAEGVSYEYDGTSTGVPSMPGWKPVGAPSIKQFDATTGVSNNSREAVQAWSDYIESLGDAPSEFPLPTGDGTQLAGFVPSGWWRAADGTEEERTIRIAQDAASIYGEGITSVLDKFNLSLEGRAPFLRELTLTGASEYGFKYTEAAQGGFWEGLTVRSKDIGAWFPLSDHDGDGLTGEVGESVAFATLTNSFFSLNKIGIRVDGNALFNISDVVAYANSKIAMWVRGGGTLKLSNSAFQKRSGSGGTGSLAGILLQGDRVTMPAIGYTPFEFYWSNVTAALGGMDFRTIDLTAVADAGGGELTFTLDNSADDDGAHWITWVNNPSSLDNIYPNEIIITGTAGDYDGVTSGAYDGVWKIKSIPSDTTVNVVHLPNARADLEGGNPIGAAGGDTEASATFTATATGSASLQADDVVMLGDETIHDVNDGYIVGGHLNDHYWKQAYNMTYVGTRVKRRRRVGTARRITVIGSHRARSDALDSYFEYDGSPVGAGEIGSFNPFDLYKDEEWDWATNSTTAIASGNTWEHETFAWGLRTANKASGKTSLTHNGDGHTFNGIASAYNAVYAFPDRLTLMAGGKIKSDGGNIIHLYWQGLNSTAAMDVPTEFGIESRGARLVDFDKAGTSVLVTANSTGDTALALREASGAGTALDFNVFTNNNLDVQYHGPTMSFLDDAGTDYFRLRDGDVPLMPEGLRVDELLTVTHDQFLLTGKKTPASASATGTTGTICKDDDYIYVCTATDTWKRAALSTW